jgi:hypothetical protein
MNELRYEAPEAIVLGKMDEVFLGDIFWPEFESFFSGSW